MKQIELFEGLEPIQKYLHVWTEAERAARVKKPRDEAQGECPDDRVEEAGVREAVMQPSCTSDEEPASQHQRANPRT